MSNLWNYLAECTRLLYWIYFKPYTFEKWLKTIHPDLKPTDHPYLKLKEFPDNKRLRRYANQVFWLTVITPQLAILVVGITFTALTQENFDWFISEVFVIAWFISQVIAKFAYSVWGEKFSVIAFGILAVSFVATSFWDGVALSIVFGVVFSVVFNVVFSLVSGIVFSVVFNVAFSAVFNVASNTTPDPIYSAIPHVVAPHIVSTVAFSVVSGIVFGVLFSVVLNVASNNVVPGVIFGVVLNVVLAAAFDLLFMLVFNVFSIGALFLGLLVPLSITFTLGVLRIYFWLPELLWQGLLFLSTPQGKFAARLRYLPPYFDQIIRLPLPFMATMIVRAYQENPEAARKTIDYLTNFTNQQKVAAKAIVEITLDTLERCNSLRDIIAITEELTWLPSPPPADIGTVLSQFLDISRDVQSADMATSAYRKAELLKIPIDSLSQQRNSFAFIKNSRVATISSEINQKWLSILTTAKQNLERQTTYSQEIPQAYIAGASLDPETAKSRFKGRRDLFRELESISMATPSPTLLLYGNRRTGKTSTLKYLPQKVGGSLIPLMVDLQGIASATTLSGVAKSLVRQIIDSARISRNLTLPYPDKEELKEDPFLTLQDWFTEIENTARGKRFLLCLDEFERLEEIISATNSRAPLNFLRHVMQNRPAWTLLFSGSHTLDEMATYWSDYLIGTRYVRLTYLEQSEAEELITQPVPDFPNIYLPETIATIVHWTRCQPFLVQLLCSELVDYLNREYPRNNGKIKATPQHMENILDKALVTASSYFNEFWDLTLTASQREALRKIIKEIPPTAKDQQAWRKLVDKEILQWDGEDRFSFQVPLIEKSVRQKIEQEL